jgi:hypothetical protein
MRYEILTGVKMQMVVFWVVTLCGLAGGWEIGPEDEGGSS